MKKYIKENGELPKTDFEKGDIVVYEGKNQTNIIILDSIGKRCQGDIFFHTMLTKTENGMLLRHLDKEDFRNWYNHDILREATKAEVKELLDVILMHLPNGFYNCEQQPFFKKLNNENTE